MKVNAADEEFVSKYETWDFEGSEEELTDYYIENDIRPASASPGTDVKIVAEDDGIPTYLSGRFPEYTSWMKSNNARDVSYTYGSNPVELKEDNSHIEQAKKSAGITRNSIGCGPIAMMSQFEFLASSAGYGSIASELDGSINRTKIAEEILKKTATIPADSWLGQAFGVSPDAGTFTFPAEVISSAYNILETHI